VAHYDARGLGLGYLVSAKAWAAVHDPGCTDINLGMFTHASGGAGNSDSNAKFKCEDLDKFKQTLSHARAVQQLDTPWIYSITAIHLYLENIKWGYRHFSNQRPHQRSDGLCGPSPPRKRHQLAARAALSQRRRTEAGVGPLRSRQGGR
jgi:hypothetical protein